MLARNGFRPAGRLAVRMRSLLLALVLLGSLIALAPHASACMTPAGGGGGCGGEGPVFVCLGPAIDSGCGADIVCVTQNVQGTSTACVQNNPL